MINITHFLKVIGLLCVFFCSTISAQTVVNGFFPAKNDFTFASSYSYKSYDNFFRGDVQTIANPANMGEISSDIVSIYAEYGVMDWLSATMTLPYISTKNSTGALDPVSQTDEVSGIQDLSLFLKGKVISKSFSNSSKIELGGIAGASVPVGGYEEAGILSIGNGALAIDGGAVIQLTSPSNLFVELQALYSYRNNADFEVPNAALFSAKLGYYTRWFYAHVKIGVQNSLDGLDIGTPEFAAAGGAAALPETEVDYTNFNFDLYVPVYKQNFGISAGYNANMTGRNYDRTSGYSVGLVYKTN
ncbi:hypothetical protein ACE939_15090 [Aquimarina sp. W85]|uniref:hypothetical protein n=1 Tax=Aquimarina rhodophyticola TaxID=3342246 RepID=UPI00366ECEE0